MKDKDRIKIKIQKILMESLEPEEFALVSYISVEESDDDKKQVLIDNAVVKEIAKIAYAKIEEDNKIRLKKLEEYIGCNKLQNNEFTTNIANRLEVSGNLSDKQIASVKLNEIIYRDE